MSKSILLADDSATIRKVVELTFGETEIHVECVSSGTEALARLEVLRPDLVLADVVMPEPTGYELCRRIKASDRPVPVILLAGTFEAFDHDQARDCGADGCLLKPFDGRMLVDRVASLIANREALLAAAVEPAPVAAPAVVPEVRRPAVPVPPEPTPGRAAPAGDAPEFGPRMIDVIAEAVVRRLSDQVVREIAREVVPRVAEAVVRERIREIENEDPPAP